MAEEPVDLQAEWRDFCDRLAEAAEVVLDPTHNAMSPLPR